MTRKPHAHRLRHILDAVEDRSVSPFVLDSALARAPETLPDRRRFELTGQQWDEFIAALDAAPRATPRLARLLREKSVFDHAASD